MLTGNIGLNSKKQDQDADQKEAGADGQGLEVPADILKSLHDIV